MDDWMECSEQFGCIMYATFIITDIACLSVLFHSVYTYKPLILEAVIKPHSLISDIHGGSFASAHSSLAIPAELQNYNADAVGSCDGHVVLMRIDGKLLI